MTCKNVNTGTYEACVFLMNVNLVTPEKSAMSDGVVCAFTPYFVLTVTTLTVTGKMVLVLQLPLSIFSQRQRLDVTYS